MKPSKNWPISGVIKAGLTALLLVCPLCNGAQGKDLGQVGPVYPIAEQTAAQRNREKPIEQPGNHTTLSLPVSNTATEHYLDLTYTVPADITDETGKVIYPKGYQFNPLEHRRFRTLIAIDGSDDRQIEWLETLEDAADPMTRIVITKGDKAALFRRLNHPVYRLHPQVAERFHITSVPTVIRQKGETLAVTAIPIE